MKRKNNSPGLRVVLSSLFKKKQPRAQLSVMLVTLAVFLLNLLIAVKFWGLTTMVWFNIAACFVALYSTASDISDLVRTYSKEKHLIESYEREQENH